jgi:periplasmic divalent cation tolerance protein
MNDCNQSEIQAITTTVGSEVDAHRLANGLLTGRLAACVQVDAPMLSIYRWQGRICEETEVRLTIKTACDRLALVQEFLARHHPYEMPEVAAVRMAASFGYASWVYAETRPVA